ncbi:MAG: 4-phosphoerythronate dehydrogenase PdxB [Bacteroidales bacterium]|nr:4-phosphoerythronate dehydrogenase PdxB [Bacteroidales bacterium]
MTLKVIADDKIPFLQGELEPFLDIEYIPGSDISREMLKDTDALIIRTRTRCDEELLSGTAVKFIATATIGFDHIDVEYCRKAGITWKNAPGCNSGSVMQFFSSALLTYARENGIDLKSRVLGIVGVGNVGSKILKVGESLGMQIILNDPPRARAEGPCGYLSLDGILREADIITFHVPLSMQGEDRTFHLADSSFFEKMNRKTLFINSSRGEVVDTKALYSALKNGKASSAILDVWENEPRPDPGLLEACYFATPHIAGYSVDGKANGTKMSVQALSRFFDLGIDEWEPEDLPEPENPLLHVDPIGKSFQEVLTELVLQTYRIAGESQWLKEDPEKFEAYRGSYPIRREFHAYSVEAKNMDETDKRKLRKLGFKIL